MNAVETCLCCRKCGPPVPCALAVDTEGETCEGACFCGVDVGDVGEPYYPWPHGRVELCARQREDRPGEDYSTAAGGIYRASCEAEAEAMDRAIVRSRGFMNLRDIDRMQDRLGRPS